MIKLCRLGCNQYLGVYQARVLANRKLLLVYESASLHGSVSQIGLSVVLEG